MLDRSALTLFVLTVTGIVALSAASQAEDKPLTLKEAKAVFEKHDRALNAVWEQVKKQLSAAALAALKEEQRAWVEWRDHIALSPGYSGAPAEEGLAKQSPEYFSTAAALTEARAAWLKGLLANGTNESLTGSWTDSYGGLLEIVEQQGKLHFSINVVRGPSAHVGQLSGIARWNEPIGWFSDKGRDKDKTDETNLAFVMDGMKLEITGANTQPYHGARAHFDGAYVRTGGLDAAAQAVVIKAARDGQPTD